MTAQKYKLKHIRFKSNRRITPTHVHNVVLELYKWAISDYSCYRIINSFFDSNRNNNETQAVIGSRIEDLKEEQEVLYNNSVNRYSFYKLKKLLLDLFNNSLISAQDYRMIYSYYLEYITMQWRRTSGRFGKVVYEPLIKYKRKELFGNKDFSKSKCDVVYKNNRDKSLCIYECKFGLSTFYYHLRVDINTATGKLKKREFKLIVKFNI